MLQDGKFHVRDDKELKKYTNPIKNKEVDNEMGIGAGDRIDKLEKQVKKLRDKITGLETQNLNLIAKVLLMEMKLNKFMEVSNG